MNYDSDAYDKLVSASKAAVEAAKSKLYGTPVRIEPLAELVDELIGIARRHGFDHAPQVIIIGPNVPSIGILMVDGVSAPSFGV